MNTEADIIIVGAGAAGIFAAIRCKELAPHKKVLVLEGSNQVLAKVKVSGGGRCNVTHACFEPALLVKNYPRGEKELYAPFQKFQPQDMLNWLQGRGVEVKAEADGRMFPVSDDSQTIIDCFLYAARELEVEISLSQRIQKITQKENIWELSTETEVYTTEKLLITTGSNPNMWRVLGELGHTIVTPVPSLFTFNIQDERLKGLSGISLAKVKASIPDTKLSQEGALLVTHWGLSGPAILRLSAWGARILAEKSYNFPLKISFLPEYKEEDLNEYWQKQKSSSPKKLLKNTHPSEIPARLWQSLLTAAQIPDTLTWADASKKALQNLSQQLLSASFEVKGKSTFKEEFVSAGGVKLKEINFRKMESKLFPNLFFAGEVLDIDAITGGFNFQAAWTTAWLAAEAMAESEN